MARITQRSSESYTVLFRHLSTEGLAHSLANRPTAPLNVSRWAHGHRTPSRITPHHTSWHWPTGSLCPWCHRQRV